jgi:hypothetical protein
VLFCSTPYIQYPLSLSVQSLWAWTFTAPDGVGVGAGVGVGVGWGGGSRFWSRVLPLVVKVHRAFCYHTRLRIDLDGEIVLRANNVISVYGRPGIRWNNSILLLLFTRFLVERYGHIRALWIWVLNAEPCLEVHPAASLSKKQSCLRRHTTE